MEDVTLEPPTPREPLLLRLALESFASFRPSERMLMLRLSGVEPPATGATCDDPAAGDRVSAALLAWLCADPGAQRYLSGRKLVIRNVVVEGELDLAFATLTRALELDCCRFPDGITMHHARVPHLKVVGGSITGLRANGLRCDGDLVLTGGVEVTGGALLRNARVRGDLKCENARFVHKGARALDASGARVRGVLLLGHNPAGPRLACGERAFSAEGTVCLVGTVVSGEAVFDTGEFTQGENGRAILANRLSVGGSLRCKGMASKGIVSLIGARIRGSVEMRSATLEDPKDRDALSMDGATVGVDVRLTSDRDAPFSAKGTVHLIGGTVGGDIECEGSFASARNEALHIGRTRLGGNLYIDRGFAARGKVVLTGMHVGGKVACRKASFTAGEDGEAVNASGITVQGDFSLVPNHVEADKRGPVEVRGVLDLTWCTIRQSVNLVETRFTRPPTPVPGRRARALSGGVTHYARALAGNIGVLAKGATIGGDVELTQLDGFAGTLDFSSASVGRHFRWTGGECGHHAPVSTAAPAALPPLLSLENATVQGSVSIRDVRGIPDVLRMDSCTVGQNLSFAGIGFRRHRRTGVSLDNAKVAGELCWEKVECGDWTEVLFTDASAGRLTTDGITSWPSRPDSQLCLAGFTYGALVMDGTQAKDWLALHRGKTFHPQPYEQLSRVLRLSGYEDEAKEIAVAKYRAQGAAGDLAGQRDLWARFRQVRRKTWSWLQDKSIRYGYDTWPAVVLTAGFITLGWILFIGAQERGAVLPSDEVAYLGNDADLQPSDLVAPDEKLTRGYPSFNPLVYSLDTFLPVIDLHQESYWKPVAHGCGWWSGRGGFCGRPLRVYLWIHIVIGWVLTTLLVVSLTGLVRKE